MIVYNKVFLIVVWLIFYCFYLQNEVSMPDKVYKVIDIIKSIAILVECWISIIILFN